ncbi:hypothetical protein ACJ73_01909 [Blastomyces percursus]|uniref:Uncharacterized protein n=1 Tax=Blastomyces percursus TaxID=1658174 RepID=A0A1J9RGD2_9EURO|nr:hypothetical protein ACJ73_01909 [Blastomyces percursus]
MSSRSSSSVRSRSARSDNRASITMAQYETLNIPLCTSPLSITVRSTPEHHPFDLSGFNPNLGVLVSQEQQDWSSIPMTAAVCSDASTLPFGAGVSNPEISYSNFPLRQEHYSTGFLRLTVIGGLSSNTYAQQTYYYAGHVPCNVSAASRGYHGNFKNPIPPQPVTMLSDGSINMPAPEIDHYSLQPPQIPLVRQERHRRSIMPNTYPTSSSLHNSLNPYQISRQCPFSPASDTGIPVSSPTAEGFASRYNVSPGLQDQVRVEISRLI